MSAGRLCACSAGMPPAGQERGLVVGTAGGGLADAPWAANDVVARIGRSGEIRTGELLGDLAAATGMTVLHDLYLPMPGVTANIDHAVVGGNVVLLIDTKVWKPGWYWTLGGVTRRGRTRFEHARTRTPAMARESIGRFLDRRGVPAIMPVPVVAVWASKRSGRASVRFLRMTGCHPIRAQALPRQVRRLVPRRPADRTLVQALSELVARPSGLSRSRMASNLSTGSERDGRAFTARSVRSDSGAPWPTDRQHLRPHPGRPQPWRDPDNGR